LEEEAKKENKECDKRKKLKKSETEFKEEIFIL
jgi:hypothetical protein